MLAGMPSPLLFVALFLFGVLSALFGPVKYGILPDQLREDELTGGNALIEAATFLAILLGTIGGSIAAAHLVGAVHATELRVAGALLAISLALMGFLALHPADRAGGTQPRDHPQSARLDAYADLDLRVDRRLWIGAMVVSWFWLVGAMAISLLPSARANRLQRQRICDQPVPDGLRHRRRARLVPRGQGFAAPIPISRSCRSAPR